MNFSKNLTFSHNWNKGSRGERLLIRGGHQDRLWEPRFGRQQLARAALVIFVRHMIQDLVMKEELFLIALKDITLTNYCPNNYKIIQSF
jgi:hypothetical protein